MKFICLTRNRLLVPALVIFTLVLSEFDIKAQNTVGIGTPSPNTNAVLDLVSPQGNQGVLVPRISTSQRQSMASSLGIAETGLVVFDADLKQFFHWVDNIWVVGLGAFSDVAGGDLQGNFPNPTLRPDVVNSATILDGSIIGLDIALNSISSGHIDGEGIGNAVLGTDAGGQPRWEPKSGFLSNSLTNGSIRIGDAADIAQPRVISGDIALSNDGTVTISDDAITSNNILDNSITSDDIGTDAITDEELAASSVGSDAIQDGAVTNADLSDSSVDSNKILDNAINTADIATNAVTAEEIATGAVTSDEIADGTVQSADIANGAVTSAKIQDGSVATDDIESGGNNKVLITTGAGTVFWENISLFETSTLPEGNIFVGDVSNTAAPLNARGAGRILIGDGTSVQSLSVNGDISLSATGDAQINTGVVGSPEVTDNSLTSDDIALDAITASELADDAVDNSSVQDNAISTTKIQDDAITNQKIATGAVASDELADGSIVTNDLSDDAVSTAKIDGEGNNNAVLTTNGSGTPQWEARSNFGTSSLPDANIFIGDGAGVSQPRPVSGDVSISNIGNVQINNDVITTAEIVNNSVTVDDIGPNAIESSELADNAVDAGAIQTDAVTTTKIANDAVNTTKIDGGGNSSAILTTDGLGNPQWETKAGLDVDPTNEIQDLSLAGNVLSLSADPSTVDLSGYLDNTDNQDLSDVLSQGSDAGASSITNLANPSAAQDAATKSYVDALDAADTDGDPTNEIQDLSLAGNTLSLTSDASTVDLSGYLDNTDAQDLSLAGNTLSLTGDATSVDLSSYLDNTDAQDLSLAGNTLSLTGDATSVDLSSYLDNTDAQDLSLAGNTLSLSGDATPVDLSSYLDNTDNQNLSSVLSQGSSAGGSAITNLANPTAAQDAATKSYVDNLSVGTGNINDGAVTTAKLSDGTILNADVNAAAAIDGSKISPDFGAQNIQTTGTLNTGTATVSSLVVSDLSGANDSYTGDGAVNSFTISATGAFSSSDKRLKENIEEIPGALQRITQVEGKSYLFKNDDQDQIHYGVIAQDIRSIFPNLVKENEQGYLSVNYMELIPVLIEALKAQQETIDQLSTALSQGKDMNSLLKAELAKQGQLLKAQQFIITQLQMDRAATERDIREIRQSLGLEAKK